MPLVKVGASSYLPVRLTTGGSLPHTYRVTILLLLCTILLLLHVNFCETELYILEQLHVAVVKRSKLCDTPKRNLTVHLAENCGELLCAVTFTPQIEVNFKPLTRLLGP